MTKEELPVVFLDNDPAPERKSTLRNYPTNHEDDDLSESLKNLCISNGVGPTHDSKIESDTPSFKVADHQPPTPVDQNDKNEVGYVNVKVVDNTNNDMHCKLKRTAAFKKLMEAYCTSRGKYSVRFFYHGDQIFETQNPDELKMNDGDWIEILVEQIGGLEAEKIDDDVVEENGTEEISHVKLKIVDDDNNATYFKLKRTTAFKKLMEAYCTPRAKWLDSVRFFYHGDQILETQNPDELKMNDGDWIEILAEQIGGLEAEKIDDDVVEENGSEEISHVKLKIVDDDNNVTCFELKRTAAFKKLMEAYCIRQGKCLDSVRFIYLGHQILESENPDELEMKTNDGNWIEVLAQQIGGLEAEEIDRVMENNTDEMSYVKLKIVDHKNSDMYFKHKRTTAFKKMMEHYCARYGKGLDSVRFSYLGNRILETQNPDELNMNDGGWIEVLAEQIDGGLEANEIDRVMEKNTAETSYVNLKVVDHGDNEVYFKLKRTTAFKKLMEAYCIRQGKQFDLLRFFYLGNRILETQNPDDLNMKDVDVIEVLAEQIGGLDAKEIDHTIEEGVIKEISYVALKVVDHDNNYGVYFRLKGSTPFEKLMEHYCTRQGKSLELVRFFYNGDRVLATQTPEELQMRDGDVVEEM